MAEALVWVLGLGLSAISALLFVPRRLWHRWRERLVDYLDKALRRKINRYMRRYREQMLSALRFVDNKGLATIGFYTPELDEVFVDVGLTRRAPHHVPEGVIATAPSFAATERHVLSDFLDKDQPALLAVIGAPGSGKTTLLRFSARQILDHRRGRKRSVPVLLYLRDHLSAIVADPALGLEVLAARWTSDVEPPGWFDSRLRAGDCVVLLDGLDEVASQGDRRTVADWVEHQVQRYSRNDFVISSRPQGYRDAPIDGALVLQVRGFTGEQIYRFVRGWYGAIERHSIGVSGEDVQRRAQESADDLIDRLRNAPALAALTVNPLLLTMLTNVHRYRGALPGSRVDLYGEICQVMLWRRQEAKRLKSELSGERKEDILRSLAFTMMLRKTQNVERTELLDHVKRALRRTSTSMSESSFVADVSSNGLLVEREAGQYAFSHLTFQEYLAAMYIRDRGEIEILAHSIEDSWWRETTLLYAARSDGDLLVDACLECGSVTSLALAFDIADNGDVDEPLRERLSSLLEDATSDPERRR